MKLSIIIPVYNEKRTIAELLGRVSAAPVQNYIKEIILVNDGSNDGSKEVLPGLAAMHNARLISHRTNKGKGAAIRTALSYTTGDLVLIQDADLEYDPADYEKLLAAQSTDTPVVYGSRNLGKTNRGYSHYVLGAALLTRMTNLLFGAKLTDMYTCYKLFPRAMLNNLVLRQNGFSFEAEVTAKILKKHIPIVEVPIHYYPRSFSQGKKIRFSDAATGAWTLIVCRFAP
ncbi:MAG: glycosyltransferase family 2 protein [Candidatus Sungbacteria bacterium]|nr:glycosyltransferase family 2 protein [bacterium]MDZ4260137.1 glycosyltransferase family 2 protein [Candidatus Sungbacteria bacterium]